MIESSADWLKWAIVFGGPGGNNGAGQVPAYFGELQIIDNFRATTVPFPTLDWIKVEAGDAADPVFPPQYQYQVGNNSQWAYDALNTRLVYIGSKPTYFLISAAYSAFLLPPTSATPIYFSVRKNGDSNGGLINKAISVVLLPTTNPVSCVCQASDLFSYGDYVEPVVRNNSNDGAPVVEFMNLFVQALGLSLPVVNVMLIDNNNNPIVDNDDQQIEGAINA